MDSFHSTWAPLLYLIAGILFILALRGLSSPATSRAGNRNGMIGMGIAVATTLALVWNDLDLATSGLILGGVAVGGVIGAIIARRIPMTAMPQLVAAFHSLVGLAAVLVAAAPTALPFRRQSKRPLSLNLVLDPLSAHSLSPDRSSRLRS